MIGALDDVVVENKESSDREHPKGIPLVYTLPERGRLNKRIKVIEPNVSVWKHG